jgi:hypothetical protein
MEFNHQETGYIDAGRIETVTSEEWHEIAIVVRVNSPKGCSPAGTTYSVQEPN